MGERIVQAVAGLNLTHEKSPLGRVTVSVGVAGRPPNRDTDWTEVLERADQALYEAKRSGKNRVSCGLPKLARLSLAGP